MHRLLAGSRLAIILGVHGDCFGEITTQPKPELIAATVALIDRLLGEKAH